jgi:hypothetical protein
LEILLKKNSLTCAFQQISTLARYSSNEETGPLEKVAVGIWAGLSFMITGIVFWRSSNKDKLARV